MKTKRSRACDISQKVKDIVWERDNHCCVVCGNSNGAMPNAHYISRSHGGLGIPENIVTMCGSFTQNKCHYFYDNGTAEQHIKCNTIIKEYLQSKYPGWDESKLVYKKQGR